MQKSIPPQTGKAWVLLTGAIFFWGINWPLMKMGQTGLGPLWFAAIRIALGALVLFFFLIIKGQFRLPDRQELPVLLSVGIFQLGLFMALIHAAVQFVDAGRSATLVYTTPIWTAAMAYIFLSEKLNRPQVIGVLCAVAGLLVLFNPLSFPWENSKTLFGNGMLICASIVGASVIVHVRGFGWSRPHIGLLPWQLALGASILLPLAFAIEGTPQIPLTNSFFAIMAFNAILATAFSFWAFLYAAKTLPATTTAMASLGVPVVGIIASITILGEALTLELLVGLGLIVIGQIIFQNRKIKLPW